MVLRPWIREQNTKDKELQEILQRKLKRLVFGKRRMGRRHQI